MDRHDNTKATAYCFANGEILIGIAVPDGAKVIAIGPSAELRRLMAVTARHAHVGGILLVPGVPEAVDLIDAEDALLDWIDWLDSRHPPGIEFPLANQDKADRSTSIERFQRTARAIEAETVARYAAAGSVPSEGEG